MDIVEAEQVRFGLTLPRDATRNTRCDKTHNYQVTNPSKQAKRQYQARHFERMKTLKNFLSPLFT
jgi:hypothetical protein